MNKMNKFKIFMKAHWITVWLVATVLAFTAIVSAEYISNRNRVRRVAANVANEGQQFSSNYLMTGPTEIKKASFNAGDNGFCVIPVTIWNHSVTNPTKAYQGELPYKLEAWLVSNVNGTLVGENADKLTAYPVAFSTDGTNFTNFNSLSYDNSKGYYYSDDTLTFNAKDTNGNYTVDDYTFYIRFPDTVLTANPDLYVKVVATPDNANDFVSISAIMGAQKAGTIITRGWTGGFSDNTAYIDYDAFNYVISGSGKSNITFSWCTDYLEMSDINLNQYGWIVGTDITSADDNINGVHGNWKTLTFTANSDEMDDEGHIIGINRYALQLYMTGDPNIDYGSGTEGATSFWTKVNSYVSFSVG